MRIKISIVLFFLTACINWQVSYAQSKDSVYKRIDLILVRHLSFQGRLLLDADRFKNKAFCFGFAINVNDKGMVDSVWYSNKTVQLDSLVSFSNISKLLMKEKTVFNQSKNTVIVGIAYFRRFWDYQIEDVFTFDKNLTTIIPQIPKPFDTKSVKILPTFAIIQTEGSH